MRGKEEFDKWLKEAVERNAPAMADSAIYVGIVTKNFIKDPLCALQLGLAILMDKPIILIADKDEKLPEALVKIAKVIERNDMNSRADFDRATASIATFVATIK